MLRCSWFFTTRRGVLKRSFSNHFYWVLNKIEEWSGKRVVLCSYRCFRESNELRCHKVSVREPNIFSRAAFSNSFLVFIFCFFLFLIFLFQKFDYYLVLFLGLFNSD